MMTQPTTGGCPDLWVGLRRFFVSARLAPEVDRRISTGGQNAKIPMGTVGQQPPKRQKEETVSEGVENLILEQLKRIQAEQSAARDRDLEMMSRIAHLEITISRIARDEATNYAEIIEDRHTVDRIKERIDRIERRLELI